MCSQVLDITLEVGAIAEQVTVTAEAPLVERSSATVSSALDRAALQALPTFGRNSFYASISIPGVPIVPRAVSTFGTSNFWQVTSVGGFARAVQFQARLGW